ncbi:MAG: hypothetical protein ACRC9Q_03960 [Bacteroidales bacterium]
MKMLRFLLVGVFLVSLSAEASAKHGLGTNNDIEMQETLPDMGLKSLVPGKLIIDVEQDHRSISIDFQKVPSESVSIRIERANGQIVLEETRLIVDGVIVELGEMRHNGVHKLIVTDGHTKYEGAFVVKGNR